MAAPCRAIQKDPELVYEYTNKWNTVAVVSDGTRVLGLGDIGPKAGLPVMEGKALLFKYLGGVDAVPIMLDTKDPDEIIHTVLLLQPAFGGVNLEDISQPKCFRILDTLREKAEIPIWHDDQQGTACVTVAGLLNALKIVGKPIDEVRVAFIGTGAANVAISRLCFKAGVDPAKCADGGQQGHPGHVTGRTSTMRRAEYVDKWRLCEITNAEGRQGGIAEALAGADVCMAAQPAGAGHDQARVGQRDGPRCDRLRLRQPGAGDLALGSGGGRSGDRGHRALGLPQPGEQLAGLPRHLPWHAGRAGETITDEMCIAAAEALAGSAPDGGLDPHCILPTMTEWEVFAREAVAVGMKAQEQGIARPCLYRPTSCSAMLPI